MTTTTQVEERSGGVVDAPYYYAGIDLGTSGVKVAIMDGVSGVVVASATSPLTVSRPQPLWCEQDPEAWWSATNAAFAQLRQQQQQQQQAASSFDLRRVRAIGLSGQMHGATLLDAQLRVLRPCILWCDGRCARECAELEAAVPHARTTTGNCIMPGFTAGKLLWVRKHEPAVFARVHKVLLPKDYLRMRMTDGAVCCCDASDASGTMWLNTAARDWDDDLLAATGLTRAHMPTLCEGVDVTGYVRGDVAASWGLSTQTRVAVVGGGGDNAAGAVGAGLHAPGQAMLSLGTSGVYFVVSGGFHANTREAVHSFCHALPGRWHLMSVMLSCTSCVDWAAALLGCTSVQQFVDLAAEAGGTTTTTTTAQQARLLQAPYFLPYLAGERTPHNNAHAKGVFFGLTLQHTRADVARAVLEGVSFALASGMDAVHRCDVTPSSITLIGGGSRSALWRQMLADVSGQPLEYCTGAEVGPALGACRLAQIALEAAPTQQKQQQQAAELCTTTSSSSNNKDTASACSPRATRSLTSLLPRLPLKQRHVPDAAMHAMYAQRRRIFAQLYTQLYPLMSSAKL